MITKQQEQIQGRELSESYIKVCGGENRVTVYRLYDVHFELMRLMESKVLKGIGVMCGNLILRLHIPNQITTYAICDPEDKMDETIGKKLAKRRAFDKFDSYYTRLLCELANEFGRAIERIDTKLGIK